jgi:hypothetical protein
MTTADMPPNPEREVTRGKSLDELEAANPLLSTTESTFPKISNLETDVI